MNPPLFAALLALCASCAVAAQDKPYNCPQQITTRQSLHEAVTGWSASTEKPFSASRQKDSGYSEHNLDSVGFSDGPPEEQVSLAPERESPSVKGQWTSTWTFQKSEKVWFSCNYRKTSVILSRQLPAGLRSCAVRYNQNAGIAVELVTCK
ncbi:MAG: STY0301 family protein [Pseudomonadota bacterium]